LASGSCARLNAITPDPIDESSTGSVGGGFACAKAPTRISGPGRRAVEGDYNWCALASPHTAERGSSHGATLSVYRTAPGDIGDRQVIVSLDGKALATLLFGQHVTVPIEPGPHRLRANNTLVWKTIAFEAAGGEHVRFQVTNRAAGGTMWMVGLLGVGLLLLRVERCNGAAPPPATR
jgi:hypothetical protein